MKPSQHQQIVTRETCLAGCSCRREHPHFNSEVYYGSDAWEVLAQDCATEFPTQSVLLIDDPQTHEVAGKNLIETLNRYGIYPELLTLSYHPAADEELAEEVRLTAAGKALILAVGAGTINDLGKYAADRNAIPYWVAPTAPSMNGYTSSIVAIKMRGVKRTLPARAPQRLYVNPAVISSAPINLLQAGFCDVLAKSVSDIDWRSESLIFNGSYCTLPNYLVAAVEGVYAEKPEQIGRGDKTAVNGLFHGLLISGVAMSLAGSSAPASGGEHLVSHFWDMRESVTGRTPELHGLQVGAGILLSAACYRRLAELEVTHLPHRRAAEIFAADAERIAPIWGRYASEIEQQFNNKREALLQFDELLPQHWPALKKLFAGVRSPEFFVDLFRRVGAGFTLTELRLTEEEFLLAARNARTIRERITVLDFATHAHVLEEATQETLTLLKN